jgi:hypothetical protein
MDNQPRHTDGKRRGQFRMHVNSAATKRLAEYIRKAYGEPQGMRRPGTKGVSVRELAERYDVSKSWVSYVVNGDRG